MSVVGLLLTTRLERRLTRAHGGPTAQKLDVLNTAISEIVTFTTQALALIRLAFEFVINKLLFHPDSIKLNFVIFVIFFQ